MTTELFDAVSRIARHEAESRSWASLGVVTEVHTKAVFATDHSVSVELRDSKIVVPRVPVAVGALGFAATPAVGDLVMVVFADGDPHAGVVVGRVYNRDISPPDLGDGQVALQLPPGGTDINVLADPKTPELTIVVGEATVGITGRTATIAIGDAEIRVDGNSPAAVTVSAGDSSLSMGANGSISIEAATKLEIKAPEIKIEGSARVEISGGLVEVN